MIPIKICQTLLLFPFVTNQSGFDTGIVDCEHDQDPNQWQYGWPQAGTCTLSWYDGTTKTAQPPTPNVRPAAGSTVHPASTAAPGFQGYMMALCNFQLAHGFAFISDIGARNLAMGYLALIVNDPGTGARQNVNTTTSENGAH